MTEKLPVLPTFSSSDDTNEYPLSIEGYSLRVFPSIEKVPADWEKAAPPRNSYLRRPIHQAIEAAPPKDTQPSYLIFYKNNQPIGVAYCQITRFKTDENVQDKAGKGALKSITNPVKSFLARRFEYTLLVCGNLLFTGEHGYYFDENQIALHHVPRLLDEALQKTQEFWKNRNVSIDGIFIKDIGAQQTVCRKYFLEQSYRQFLFHPNMVLHLQPKWNNFDDYLNDLSSKYRVRVRKAFKCGQTLHKANLTLEQLRTNVDHLYQLYQNVMVNAGFNMVVLHENYIIKLKEYLGDRFLVTGYYLNGELIGYRTNILNFDELEAHFLGYDHSFNKECQLYMNMLLDSLKLGIHNKVDRIVYARTAMEIKSSIGATPENLFGYIRANSKVMNWIMAPLLEFFRPNDNWIQRKPFKTNNETTPKGSGLASSSS